MKNRAEDSTRGRSNFNPRSYKGDVLTQVWMDSRMLATLTRALEANGTFPRFMSEVVREGVYAVVENLVENGVVEMVEDTRDAREMLERRFRINLNNGGRGMKNVVHNLVLSERRKGSDVAMRNYEAEKDDVKRQLEEAIRVSREQGRLVEPSNDSEDVAGDVSEPDEVCNDNGVNEVTHIGKVKKINDEEVPSNAEEREEFFARKLRQTAEEDKKLAEMDLTKPLFE